MSTIVVGASILEGYSTYAVIPKLAPGKEVEGIYLVVAILEEKAVIVVGIGFMQPICVMDSNLLP